MKRVFLFLSALAVSTALAAQTLDFTVTPYYQNLLPVRTGQYSGITWAENDTYAVVREYIKKIRFQ